MFLQVSQALARSPEELQVFQRIDKNRKSQLEAEQKQQV